MANEPKIPFQFGDFIDEELAARGWDRDDLAMKMLISRYSVLRLGLDFLLCEPRLDGLMFDDETAEQMAAALDVDKEYLKRLWDSTAVPVRAAEPPQ